MVCSDAALRWPTHVNKYMKMKIEMINNDENQVQHYANCILVSAALLQAVSYSGI